MPGKIERNADTHERHRANWQRLVTGAGTEHIIVTAPLHNSGGSISLGFAVNETPSGTINSINASFTLAHQPLAGTLMVWVNGVMMLAGASADYSLSTTTITFHAGAIPETGDWIRVAYLY